MRETRIAYIIIVSALTAAFLSVAAEGAYAVSRAGIDVFTGTPALIGILAAFALCLRQAYRVLKQDGHFIGRGAGAITAGAGMICYSIARLGDPILLLICLVLLLLFIAVSYPYKVSLTATALTGAAAAAVYVRNGSELWAVTALMTGLVFTARIYGERIMTAWRETSRLFNQARWAASELSNVVMRLEESVHKARIYEITNERKRVAREVHDTIGYTLTGLIVQIEVAGKLVTNPVAKKRLESLLEIARKALHDVRREVTALREDIRSDSIVSWSQRWVQACDYFSECTGVRVDHHIHESLDSIPGEIGEMFYRIIQEGLTNAYRHGEATKVDVSMTWKETIGMILFRISDNGVGTGKLKAGNGLRGIKERIEMFGGTLAYDSLPGKGFDLGVDLPWGGGAYGTNCSAGG